MPHLRAFNTNYAARGLQIIAVSSEQEWEIEPYLELNGIDYGVARALGVGRMFGNTAVPHAWLIDSGGSVVWEGHTGKLTEATINSVLGAAVTPAVLPGNETVPTSGGTWWIWLIICPAVLFAAAMGWFLWSTRDRTANYQTAFYPQQQYAPQPQGPQPQAPPQQAYLPPQQQYPNQYGAPQPFPHPPASYPVQEPYQQMGYHGSPGSSPDTRFVGRPNAFGAHDSQESPGAAAKPAPPPLEQRPYLGQDPGQFPPFDTNRNPPRSR